MSRLEDAIDTGMSALGEAVDDTLDVYSYSASQGSDGYLTGSYSKSGTIEGQITTISNASLTRESDGVHPEADALIHCTKPLNTAVDDMDGADERADQIEDPEGRRWEVKQKVDEANGIVRLDVVEP